MESEEHLVKICSEKIDDDNFQGFISMEKGEIKFSISSDSVVYLEHDFHFSQEDLDKIITLVLSTAKEQSVANQTTFDYIRVNVSVGKNGMA